MNALALKRSRTGLLMWGLCACLAVLPARAPAEDIDIFVTDPSRASTFDNPNVLIILDNTSNWSRASQKWPADPDTGEAQMQGQAELQAIKTVIGALNDSINVGLMLFTDTGTGREGGYIRFPVMQMTPTNKTVFQNLAQYIYDNFSSPSEKTSSSANYSAVMFDAFKYFGGYTSPANVAAGTAGTQQDATHFGPLIFNQRTDASLAAVQGALATDSLDPLYSASGYTDGSRLPTLAAPTRYKSPIAGANYCAKNFVIFIGNGFPNNDKGGPADTVARMDQYLADIGGNTTQLAVPGFTTANVTTTTDIGYSSACYASQAACQTTDFASQCGTGLTYPTCSCSGTSTTTLAACPAGQSRYQVLGNNTTTGTTTGPVAGAPLADVSAPTTACYATSAAADAAVSGGTDRGGLTNPTTSSSGTNPIVTTVYSSTWSRGSAVTPNTCALGAAGTPQVFTGTDTSACYLDKALYVSTDHGTLGCPADTATTHYECVWALKGNPNNGSNSNCPGSGATQQKRYSVELTATPYPINQRYTVTRATTTQVTNTTGSTSASTVLGNSSACYSSPPTGTPTDFSCTGYTSCTFGSATTAAACPSGARFLVQGSSTTSTVVPNNTYTVPVANKQRMADEWARYMFQTDVNSVAGQQNISTYTIDVFNAQQDADQTALMMSMARVGGGKYFAAKSKSAIVTALQQIMSEIQAVNTVFASASLPVNATNRAQNENQVFIGMFRPDPLADPRWFGNVKRYQLGDFSGVIDLADANGRQAVNLQTGFITECATSFWTSDSGAYWDHLPSNPPAEGKCTTSSFDKWSDSPDGPQVEKGAAAEVIRKGNNPPATDSNPTWVSNRNVKTVSGTSLVDFTTASSGLSEDLVNFILGKDVRNELGSIKPIPSLPDWSLTTQTTRPSVHGDVIHSRPLPVNYSTATNLTAGVTVFYGANDGTLRALNASTGKERWALIAPEFFPRLQRIKDNSPRVLFPGNTASPSRKDYFWDGSVGIFQNLDNSKVWVFPTMRRGGRMLYAIDTTTVDSPALMWKLGCPNLTDDTGCSSPDGTDVTGIGQTWSLPSVAFIKGYSTTEPVLVVGGGYDGCEDANSSFPSGCASPKGAAIYVIRARDGRVIKKFDTARSVASDVAMVDVDNDGYVDYAYATDTGGNFYRVDFVNGASSFSTLSDSNWVHYRVAYTNGAGSPVTGAPRKFFFPPALLYSNNRVYVAVGSGDREHPLKSDYPFADVKNRFYVYLDTLATKPTDAQSVDLDDATVLNDNTSATSCTSDKILASSSKKGWFMDLNQFGTKDANGLTGEQTVTSALILGGLVTFSTNRPIPPAEGSCSTTLGEARGYWVNLLNGSGAVGVGPSGTCDGDRSGTFVGGGLPPSPVTGIVPVGGVSRTVVIGAVQRDGTASAPIGGQKVVPPIKAIRKRVYWFKSIDN